MPAMDGQGCAGSGMRLALQLDEGIGEQILGQRDAQLLCGGRLRPAQQGEIPFLAAKLAAHGAPDFMRETRAKGPIALTAHHGFIYLHCMALKLKIGRIAAMKKVSRVSMEEAII